MSFCFKCANCLHNVNLSNNSNNSTTKITNQSIFKVNVNEKLARKNQEVNSKQIVIAIEQKIIDTTFPMKLYGSPIILDNGESKSVPTYVAEHWDHIKQAKLNKIPYSEALNRIKGSSCMALATFAPNRNKEITEKYYKQTLDAENNFSPSVGMKNII